MRFVSLSFSVTLLCRDVAEKSDKPSAYLVTVGGHVAKSIDPLASLAKQLGGSKRNALLKWCQNRTATYTVCVGICYNYHGAVVIVLSLILLLESQHKIATSLLC